MNIQKMMQQAQAMQQKMADMQARLEQEEAEGTAAGLVTVRINGKKSMLKVTIDESLLKPDEKETLEDLLVVAYNNASTKIDDTASTQMKQVTSGLNLPPGFKLPF